MRDFYERNEPPYGMEIDPTQPEDTVTIDINEKVKNLKLAVLWSQAQNERERTWRIPPGSK